MEGVAFGHGSAGRDASACGGSTQQDPCEVSPVGEESGTLYVEVCLKSGSTADRQIIREHVRDALSAIPMDTVFESGEVFFYKDNSQLGPHVDYMTFDLEHSCQIWQAQNVSIHVFQLSEEGKPVCCKCRTLLTLVIQVHTMRLQRKISLQQRLHIGNSLVYNLKGCGIVLCLKQM